MKADLKKKKRRKFVRVCETPSSTNTSLWSFKELMMGSGSGTLYWECLLLWVVNFLMKVVRNCDDLCWWMYKSLLSGLVIGCRCSAR